MQHYGAASTIYNFGHVSGYGTPMQVEAGLFGYGGFGQVEAINIWGTRISSALSAATKAQGVSPSAIGLINAALAEILQAKAVYDTATKNKEWTTEQEVSVANHLKNARDYYASANGIAISSGDGSLPAFPTWALAAQTLPTGAPGKSSPGVLVPATPAVPTTPGTPAVPPTVVYKRMSPTTMALIGIGLGALFFFRRRR